MAKYNYHYSYKGEGDKIKSKHIIGGIIGLAGLAVLGWYAYSNWGYIQEQFDALTNYFGQTSSPISSSSPLSAGVTSGGQTTASSQTAGGLSTYMGFGAGQTWLPYVQEAASRFNVSPALILGLIEVEDYSLNPNAESNKGALGLMQLEPATASSLGYSAAGLFSPYQNIMAGTQYLSGLLNQYGGNVMSALEAYNAGPGHSPNYYISSGAANYAQTVYNNFLNIKNELSGGIL